MQFEKDEPISMAEQIAIWSDRLRDLSATGLTYAANDYDKERYEHLQELAVEMLSLATRQPAAALQPLKTTIFARMSPTTAGSAAVIDKNGKILLMRRTDNHLWAMPAGQMEVGETPAQAVVRETYEETGVRCIPRALSGIYDSRIWVRPRIPQHVYLFTFLCEPVEEKTPESYDRRETLETGWFAQKELPDKMWAGHIQRIADAYKVRNGDTRAYFDREPIT